MYFPYLRAKQNELLALRELLDAELLSEKIMPVIEPIKETSTFKSTLSLFKEKDRKIFTIINPSVGDYLQYNNHPIFPDEFEFKYDALLMNDSNINKYVATLNQSDEFITIFKDVDDLKNNKIIDEENLIAQFALITNIRFKRQLNNINDFILLNDQFEKEERNVDYLINGDKFYSDDHLHYKDEGFVGYSDYSIIGEEYIDSGFAPRAVAIHIVYFDEQYNLRIKHFVSDTNDDITNPAGKFSEALNKLVDWYKNDAKPINKTTSLNEFINLYEESRYPGLGYIKKISLKHHLELIGGYLDSRGA